MGMSVLGVNELTLKVAAFIDSKFTPLILSICHKREFLVTYGEKGAF